MATHAVVPEKYRPVSRSLFQADPERYRRFHPRAQFGIPLSEYEAKFAAQEGLCFVCERPESVIDRRTGKPIRLGVYHDRRCCEGDVSCGECVMDLLCRRCDAGLALANDDPEVLRGMAAYLRFWSRHQRDQDLNIVERDRAMPAGVPLSPGHCVACQTGDFEADRKRMMEDL